MSGSAEGSMRRVMRGEIRLMRQLAFACYQQCGRLGAPEIWLDTLLAASEGRAFDPSKLEQFDAAPLRIPVKGVIR